MTSTSTINVFQRLARQWDLIHPYNAAQVLQIEGKAPVEALQEAWHDALNDLGLGRVKLAGAAYHYECLNGEMALYGVRAVPAGVRLEEWISAELNRPFDNPAEPPFRPFVLYQDGHYFAGVVYSHWVADSVSIRAVLREWFVRLYDPKAASRTPVKLADGGYRKFFGPTSGASIGHGLMTAARWASSLRRARRLDVRQEMDLSVKWRYAHTPDGWIDTLHDAARRRRVTLNDMFMAAIASVCDRHVPLQFRPRRRALALGSIVDLRPFFGEELDNTFGLFLGVTNVVCRPSELRDPERLLSAVALQNQQQKKRGIPQASAFRMLAGIVSHRIIKPDKHLHFYQKHVPIAGGISNVNMNRSWATAYQPRPLMDYLRVSPTGPMMPIVFATTTLGDRFHFAMTYRPSIVPTERIDRITKSFVETLGAYL